MSGFSERDGIMGLELGSETAGEVKMDPGQRKRNCSFIMELDICSEESLEILSGFIWFAWKENTYSKSKTMECFDLK